MTESKNPDDRKEAAGRLLQFLKGTTLLQGLSEGEIKSLLSASGRQSVRADHHVYRESDVEESLYFILEGEVRLTRRVGEAEEIVGILKRGDIFGEDGLLAGGRRITSVKARKDSLLLIFEKPLFDNLDGELASKLMQNIALAAAEKLEAADHLIGALYGRLQELMPDPADRQAIAEALARSRGKEPES